MCPFRLFNLLFVKFQSRLKTGQCFVIYLVIEGTNQSERGFSLGCHIKYGESV